MTTVTTSEKKALAEWVNNRIIALRYGLRDNAVYMAMPMDAEDLEKLEALAALLDEPAPKKAPLTGKLKEYADRQNCPALTEALIGFIALRKQKRQPLTERAMTMIVNKLESMPHPPEDQAKIIDYCVERGWTTIYYKPEAFAPKEEGYSSFDTDEFYEAALNRTMQEYGSLLNGGNV